jgi:transketolase
MIYDTMDYEMKGVDQLNPLPSERDRFILSKGHGVPALYAVLHKKGLLTHAELMTLRKTGSKLQGHPDRARMPIMEASTGSLGQGLSVAQGMAMGFKQDQKSHRVFCLLGDGEMQEGQVWEALLSAPKFKLSNLCAIIDANGGQIDGPVAQVMPLDPLNDKMKAFGWNVIEIDGHDFNQILDAFSKFNQNASTNKPTLIIARTIKGKGVSFMEGKIEWHGVAPKKEECTKAIEEIKSQI